MSTGFKKLVVNHIAGHALLYAVVLSVFVLGVAGGSYAVRHLDAQQESELLDYLDVFLTGLNQWEMEPAVVAQHAVVNNLKIVFYIWFLGLTVIGVPLILLIIFFRGFVFGFTVGFLIQQKAMKGLLITLLAVVPPSIINLPAMMAGGVLAISFSYWLVRGRIRVSGRSLLGQLGLYCTAMLAAALTMGAGGLLEAYVSPIFLQFVVSLSLA